MFVAVDDSFIDHPKTVRFCTILGNELAWAYLVKLWRWAMKYAKDGDLSKFEPAEIEFAVGWRGEPGKLFEAMTKAGFIDSDPRCVHDWMDHNGRWVRKAEANRQRMEDWRLGVTKRSRNKPVRVTNDAQNNNVQRSDKERRGKVRRGKDLDLIPIREGDARGVFEHYRKYHPRTFKTPTPESKEWRLIRDRFAEGSTSQDLCDAIDGYHISPFHQGENQTGAKHLGLELMMRDGSHVAKGLELARAGPQPVVSEKTRQSMRAAVNWKAGREHERGDGRGEVLGSNQQDVRDVREPSG